MLGGESPCAEVIAPDASSACNIGPMATDTQPNDAVALAQKNMPAEATASPPDAVDTYLVADLETILTELASSTHVLSEQARDFIRKGGSTATALAKIEELRTPREPSEVDLNLDAARRDYTALLVEHHRLPHRGRRNALEAATSNYKTALAAKIEATTDLHCARCSGLGEAHGMSVEVFVERGIRVLTDTLVSEQQQLREYVRSSRKESIINKMMKSPKLYELILFGLVASSFAKYSGVLPGGEDKEIIIHTVESSIAGLAAFGFSGVAQGKISDRVGKRWAGRQLKHPAATIKRDETVADDLIVRAAGTTVSRESAESVAAHLLAGRLVKNHLEEIKEVRNLESAAVEAHHTALVRAVIEKEVARSGHLVKASERRATLVRVIALASAFIAGPAIASVAESFAITKDLKEAFAQ